MKPYHRSGDLGRLSWSETLGVSSVSSPRDARGNLLLRANPFIYMKQKAETQHFDSSIGDNRGPYYLQTQVNYLEYGRIRAQDWSDPNAVIDFYNAVGEKAMNMADLIRTRKETVSMVTNNVMKLVRSIKHLKKGKWEKAALALGVTPKGQPKTKEVPGRWLELQYGWLPLLGDVHATCTSMFRDPIISVRKTKTYTFSKSYSRSFSIGISSNTMTATLEGKLRVTHYTGIQLSSSAIVTADNLGLLNPFDVLWEATPWSFVVDWFLPIGDYLSSLTALKGVNLVDSSVTKRADWRVRGYHTLETQPTGQVPFNFEGAYKERVLGMPSRPLPAFKNPLSLGHFANAMSLLATAFSSKK